MSDKPDVASSLAGSPCSPASAYQTPACRDPDSSLYLTLGPVSTAGGSASLSRLASPLGARQASPNGLQLQDVLRVEGLQGPASARPSGLWALEAAAAAGSSSLAGAAADFLELRARPEGQSLAELLVVRPPTAPLRPGTGSLPGTAPSTALAASAVAALPAWLPQAERASVCGVPEGGAEVRALQPICEGDEPDMVGSSEAGPWQLHGSGVHALLSSVDVGTGQRLALPYDFAWALLMERCVFEAPFAERWVVRWLQGHFRSRLR